MKRLATLIIFIHCCLIFSSSNSAWAADLSIHFPTELYAGDRVLGTVSITSSQSMSGGLDLSCELSKNLHLESILPEKVLMNTSKQKVSILVEALAPGRWTMSCSLGNLYKTQIQGENRSRLLVIKEFRQRVSRADFTQKTPVELAGLPGVKLEIKLEENAYRLTEPLIADLIRPSRGDSFSLGSRLLTIQSYLQTRDFLDMSLPAAVAQGLQRKQMKFLSQRHSNSTGFQVDSGGKPASDVTLYLYWVLQSIRKSLPSDSLLSSSREVLLNIAQSEGELLEQMFAVYLLFRGGEAIDETIWRPWLDRVGELGKLEILILSGILRFNHLKELSDQIWIKQFDKKFSASQSSIFSGLSQELWFEILSLEQRRYPEATVRSHLFHSFEDSYGMNSIQKALFLYGLSLSYSGYRPSESEAKLKFIDGQELGLKQGESVSLFLSPIQEKLFDVELLQGVGSLEYTLTGRSSSPPAGQSTGLRLKQSLVEADDELILSHQILTENPGHIHLQIPLPACLELVHGTERSSGSLIVNELKVDSTGAELLAKVEAGPANFQVKVKRAYRGECHWPWSQLEKLLDPTEIHYSRAQSTIRVSD